jgi:hypothetical protein
MLLKNVYHITNRFWSDPYAKTVDSNSSHKWCRTMKICYYWGGLGGGRKFCVVDSKKWISEKYLNEKLTKQVLLPLGVEQQILVGVMTLP